MGFIHDDFLLQTPTARRLYHEYAEHQPILDYHNHLPPKDIAENRQFATLAEIWLEGDHYKWRAMRANGVEERYITGGAEPYEKFLAWARTVPHTIRNPLYHWTHLELKRYFGIDDLLNEQSAPTIWAQANAMLAKPELSTHGILRKFKVAALCTTDDPTDDLRYHEAISKSDLATRVYPAYRPDKALAADKPEAWNTWVHNLGSASNMEIRTLDDMLEALDRRHAFFNERGARLSDHGLNSCPEAYATDGEAAGTFDAGRMGEPASPQQRDRFSGYLLLHFGRLDSKRGWTKQLHLGPIRNVRSRGFNEIGPDTGHDSVGDWPQAQGLAAYLDRLDRDGALPKVILYNNNPVDNYVFATMAGNFGSRVQFGAGWWYLDTREGIEWQLNTLSNVGLLSRFVGMLTDSRSFMSYPRHEYFRRVLCNLIGRDIENGEIPDDDSLVGPMIENICFNNARDFLGLDVSV